MKMVLAVAMDLLREASSRRWFLALWTAITLSLLAVGLSLRLEVVDGALAASRFFGGSMRHDIVSVEVALRPVFTAMGYFLFYGGLGFGILACSDFASEMLAPGRIEHLLSLPIRRYELVLGTFVGVMILALGSILYGSIGFTLVLCYKSGVWTAWPVVGSLLACIGFGAVYAVMLTTSLFVRSAALSAAAGAVTALLGIIAGYRHAISDAFSGMARGVFLAVTAGLPRISTLASRAAEISSGTPLEASLVRPLLGALLFTFALISLGVFHFERKDF